MIFVSIFHNFTSLKVLHLFRFDMSTMVVTIQLMVDIMVLLIQIFYHYFFLLSNYLSLQQQMFDGESFTRILWGIENDFDNMFFWDYELVFFRIV